MSSELADLLTAIERWLDTATPAELRRTSDMFDELRQAADCRGLEERCLTRLANTHDSTITADLRERIERQSLTAAAAVDTHMLRARLAAGDGEQ